MSKPKVLVCLLSGAERSNWICPEQATMLVQMSRDPRFELEPMLIKDCRPFDVARNQCLKLARDKNVDWVVSLDNDNFLPKGTPLDVIAAAGSRQNVIGLRYAIPAAGGVMMLPLRDSSAKNEGAFEEVDFLGGGMLIVHKSVWQKIPKGPWFRFQNVDPDGAFDPRGCGEDFYFCNLVRSHGLRVWTPRQMLAGHYKTIDLTLLSQHVGTFDCASKAKAWVKEKLRVR